jgi:hypothetical protein
MFSGVEDVEERLDQLVSFLGGRPTISCDTCSAR